MSDETKLPESEATAQRSGGCAPVSCSEHADNPEDYRLPEAPEGLCPWCYWCRGEEHQLEYDERIEEDVCPQCGAW